MKGPLPGAVGVIAVAYAANAFFNHTAWGRGLQPHGDVYVFGFFFLFGVIVPAAYMGWLWSVSRASARWLGAQIGWRDVAATAGAFAVGGFLAMGALASHRGESGELIPHRLFALLLVSSTAEVMLFLGVLSNSVQLTMRHARRWHGALVALVVSSLAFGFFHLTYPAPWNTLGRALGLSLVWVPISLVFLVSRSLIAAVILNNLMAVIGFVTSRVELPGTTTAGWVHAALAVVLFAVVFRVARHRHGAASIPSP